MNNLAHYFGVLQLISISFPCTHQHWQCLGADLGQKLRGGTHHKKREIAMYLLIIRKDIQIIWGGTYGEKNVKHDWFSNLSGAYMLSLSRTWARPWRCQAKWSIQDSKRTAILTYVLLQEIPNLFSTKILDLEMHMKLVWTNLPWGDGAGALCSAALRFASPRELSGARSAPQPQRLKFSTAALHLCRIHCFKCEL